MPHDCIINFIMNNMVILSNFHVYFEVMCNVLLNNRNEHQCDHLDHLHAIHMSICSYTHPGPV